MSKYLKTLDLLEIQSEFEIQKGKNMSRICIK